MRSSAWRPTSRRSGRGRPRTSGSWTPAACRPKEMTNLQHELDSLKRRQSDLEDQELELMERSRSPRRRSPRPSRGWSRRGRPGAGRAAARRRPGRHRRRDDEAHGGARGGGRRHLGAAADAVRPDPHADRRRPARRCCRRGRARAAGWSCTATSCPRCATPTRTRCVRCENCGRILVRTAESGL